MDIIHQNLRQSIRLGEGFKKNGASVWLDLIIILASAIYQCYWLIAAPIPRALRPCFPPPLVFTVVRSTSPTITCTHN